ncbi:hypothetical protein EJB05_00521, partial [Eragrostis curvula]
MASRLTTFLLRATVALALVAASSAWYDDDDILLPFAPTCSTTNNYTDGCASESNMASLLAAMPAANGWFFNGTACAGNDTVYGLIMCYADRNATECLDCLARALAGITDVCPGSRTVSAAYDACLLREAFFVFELGGGGEEKVDAAALDAARSGLMNGLAKTAADSPPLLLVNGSAPYVGKDNKTEEVYGLAQCTRDLTAGQCAWCLTTYVGKMREVFGNHTGGATKGYSCYVRYRIGAFEITLLPAPTVAPPPSSLPAAPQPAPAAYHP